MSFPAPLRLRLDGAALIANWKTLDRLSGNAATGAAMKADAYGLGAREVVSRLWAAGCRDFFVAHWGEAEAIADLVPPANIAVLNGISEGDIAPARALGAAPVLNTSQQIGLWKASGGGRCHVMLDSGINRLGIGAEQIGGGLFDGLDIDIALSHLASADEDGTQNAAQLRCFAQMAGGIAARRKSLSNSAGIALGPDYHFDLTRPGLGLYGGVPRAELDGQLRQVAVFEARVIQLRTVSAGTPIGYNQTYVCTHAMRVATLSIGYADGYWRGFSGHGMARFGDAVLPVIGRVSMDLLTVDASAAPALAEGDWGHIDFDLPAAAAMSGLSQYELLTGLGRRAERRWF